MTPPTRDAKRDYLDDIASKLDDPTAYLEFLGAKLENSERAGVRESGILPAAGHVEWVSPRSREPGSSSTKPS